MRETPMTTSTLNPAGPAARPAPLVSALYRCRVVHERFAPKRHRFAYGLFYLALDLDELDGPAPPAGVVLGEPREPVFSP
jgi:hypothetical protein